VSYGIPNIHYIALCGVPIANITKDMYQVGQSARCVNDRSHRMRTAYVRGSVSQEMRQPGVDDGKRSMKAIGFYCFRCKQFWTFGKVRRIYEERNRQERVKPTFITRT
jgi:hypothetical protein